MITEIFVEGRRLDITADISSLLTFAIDDIRDFASRQTVFSKTIILPGTGNNNAIFGSIFETGISNAYDPNLNNIGYNFNAAKSARCLIFQDAFQTFKGTLRILEMDIDLGRVEYQVALNGDLTTLNVALSSALLTDLDFSAYDTVYNEASIVNSWDNTPGSGVYFPLIDCGTYSIGKHDWDFRTFRPALYVKEYIDKIFTAANFRYDSALFDTARFKGLVIPHNQKDVLSPKTGVLFTAISNTEQLIIDRGANLIDDGVHFDSFVGGLFTTGDNKEFTYTGASAVTGSLIITITGHHILVPLGKVQISVEKNGTDYYVDPVLLLPLGPGDFPYIRNYSLSISLNTGDTFKIHYHYSGGGIALERVWVSTANMNFSTPATITAPVEYGDTIQMQFAIPKNIRQIEFLTSVVKLWNLYIYEDQYDDRLIHIKPFIDFYEQGDGSVVDWTYKLNRNKPIKIKPMSELNSKIYNFNYRDDSDFYNDLYKKRYNQGYGSYIYDSQFEFASQTNKLELIFAPTPLVGYDGEEKVYSTIFKKSGATEDKTDSVIRILQTLKITGVVSWDIKNGVTVLGSYTVYGYAGHFDDPDNPGNDLNFGALSEIFFIVSTGVFNRTQFNVYWSGYMSEITNKDSKLLSAKFYLTPKDIFDLRFSRFITVDGVLYRLNKITDYNASIPSDCDVELLRAINIGYRFPPGSTIEDDYALLWTDTDAILWEPSAMTGDEMLYK